MVTIIQPSYPDDNTAIQKALEAANQLKVSYCNYLNVVNVQELLQVPSNLRFRFNMTISDNPVHTKVFLFLFPYRLLV